jgi:hypothetical protein
MIQRPNPQPENNESPDEALKKPTMDDALSSMMGPGAPSPHEKIALQFPTEICLKISEFLEEDSDKIATASDDLVTQYYQVVNLFLQYMLGGNKTCSETQRVQFLYLKITKERLTTLLRNYSSTKRRDNGAKKPLTLLNDIFPRWSRELGDPNGFQFYSAIQSTTPMTTQSGSLKATTAGGVAAYNAKSTPPEAAPTQPPEETTKSTRLVMPTIDFGPDGKMILGGQPTQPPAAATAAPAPAQAPAPTATQTKPITVPNAQETTNGDVMTTANPVTPPVDDGWDHALGTPEQQLESDMKLYDHPGLPMITHIFNIRPPASRESWKGTLENLETAMSISIDELKNETDDTRVHERIVNAIAKTGSPKYRKRFFQEIHALAKFNRGTNQRRITELFKNVLSNQPEYAKPRSPSENIEQTYEYPNSSRPKPEDITPAALFRGYDKLDPSEIDNMPAEIQEPIRALLINVREFGLAPVGIDATEVDIARLTPNTFRAMCGNIFQRLNAIEEQVQVSGWHASTWRKKGPKGKARTFTTKLREILTAQFAIVEELLFSKELFIPEQVRALA